jgi:hypothetical protein
VTVLGPPRSRVAVPFCVLTGAAVAVAAALGWQAGAMTRTARPEPPAIWSLPSPRATDIDGALAILAARKPWGGSNSFTESEGPVALSAAWRLVGIVQRAEQRYALVLIGSGPAARLEYRAVGETLPDGSKLVQIDVDSVTSSSASPPPTGRRVLRLFEKSPP